MIPLLETVKRECYNLYRTVVKLNYDLELWLREKHVDDIRFVSYELRNPSLEDDTLSAILNDCEDGATIVDVGSNVGHYVLSMAAALPSSEIFAFEPHPGHYKRLRKNIRLNGFQDRITTFNHGVSDEQDELTFYKSSSKGRSSFHEVRAESGGASIEGHEQVNVTKLDDMIESVSIVPDAIKIDTEGHEYWVLRGAERTLAEHSPLIYFEIHGKKETEIREYLTQLGYTLDRKDNYIVAKRCQG